MDKSPSKADSADDPASFKGQMAARYKERQSMGFHLARNEDTAGPAGEKDDSATTDEAENAGPEEQNNFAKTSTSDAGEVAEGKSPEKEGGAVAGLDPRRSMKDLITQFEKRSSQTVPESPQHLENSEPTPEQCVSLGAGEKRGLAREAWRGSNRALHMDLDAAADTSSSSSLSATEDSVLPEIESRGAKRHGHQRRRKDKYSRRLRSASSINLEANDTEMTGGPVGPGARGVPVWNGEQYGDEGGKFGVNGTNELSPETTANPNTNVLDEPAHKLKYVLPRGDEGNQPFKTQLRDPNSTHGEWQMMETEYKDKDGERVSSEAIETGTSDNAELETTVPQPLRINLKDFAARKKRSSNPSDMKYVVHRKDWRKWMQNHQGPGGTRQQKPQTNGALPERKMTTQPRRSALELRLLNKLGGPQDTSVTENSTTNSGSRRAFTSASNTQQRIEYRNNNKTPPPPPGSTNPSVKSPAGLPLRPESALRKHGGAMERYLMFLNRTSKLGMHGTTKISSERSQSVDTSSSTQRPPSTSILDQRSTDLTNTETEEDGGTYNAMALPGLSLPSSPSPRRRKEFSHQTMQALLKQTHNADRKSGQQGTKNQDTFDVTSPSSGSYISNANTLSTLELDRQTERALARLEQVTASKARDPTMTYTLTDESKLYNTDSAYSDANTVPTKTQVNHPTLQPILRFNSSKHMDQKAEAGDVTGAKEETPNMRSDQGSGRPNLYTSRRAMRSVTPRTPSTDRQANQPANRSVSPRGRTPHGSNPVVESRSRSSPASLKRVANSGPNITSLSRSRSPSRQQPGEQTRSSQRRTTQIDSDVPERRNSTGRLRQSSPLFTGRQLDADRKTLLNTGSNKHNQLSQLDVPAALGQDQVNSFVLDGRVKGSEILGYHKTLGRFLPTSSEITDISPLESDHLYNNLHERIERRISEGGSSQFWRGGSSLTDPTSELTNAGIPLRQLNTMDMIRMLRHDVGSHQLSRRNEGNAEVTSTPETLVATGGVPPRSTGRRPFPSGSGVGLHSAQMRGRTEAGYPKSSSNISGAGRLYPGIARSRSTHAANWNRLTGSSLANSSRSKSPTESLYGHAYSGGARHLASLQQDRTQQRARKRQTGELAATADALQSPDTASRSPTSMQFNQADTPTKQELSTEKTASSRPSSVALNAGRRGPSPFGRRAPRDISNQMQQRLQHRAPSTISSSTSVYAKERLRRVSSSTHGGLTNVEDPRRSRNGTDALNAEPSTSTTGALRRRTLASTSRSDQSRRKAAGTPLTGPLTVETAVRPSSSTLESGCATVGQEMTKAHSCKELALTCNEQPETGSFDHPPTEGKEMDSPPRIISREPSALRSELATAQHRPDSKERKDTPATKSGDGDSDVENKLSCHFGTSPAGTLAEVEAGEERKETSSPDASPLKRKRKLVDRMKKMRKKKRKKRDEDLGAEEKKDISPILKTIPEKSNLKDKQKEKRAKGTDADTKSVGDAATKKSGLDLSPGGKDKKKATKELSFAGSVTTPIRKESPEYSHTAGVTSVTIRRRSRSRSPPRGTRTVIKLPRYRPVNRLSNQPTEWFSASSHLPLRVESPDFPPYRRRTDVLAQYRRWREGMVDPDKPSKIPLSLGFRWTLDSAVVEEWALHCWEPDSGVYMDEQGAWWSSVADNSSDVSLQASLLADSKPFSVDGLLEFGSRLPNMKFGPLRMLHASYMLMGGACVLMGHLFARLYQCGGDDYDFFCKGDDVECLSQFARVDADWLT